MITSDGVLMEEEALFLALLLRIPNNQNLCQSFFQESLPWHYICERVYHLRYKSILFFKLLAPKMTHNWLSVEPLCGSRMIY